MLQRQIGSADLPFDVIRRVLSLLPQKTLLKLRLLNREWNRFVLHRYLDGIIRVRLVVDFRFAPLNTFILYTTRRRPWNIISPSVLSTFRSHVKVTSLKCVFPRLSYPANITYVDIMLKDLRRLIAAHHKVFNRLEDIRMGDCFKGKYPLISPERTLYRGRVRRFLNVCRGEYLKRDKMTLVSKRFFHLFTLFHRTLKRFDLRFGYDYAEKNFFLNLIWALSQNPREFTGVFSTELYEIDTPFYRQIYGSDYVMEVKPSETDKTACLILVRKVGEVEKVKQETFRLIREELTTRIGQEIVDNRIKLGFLGTERIGTRIHYFVSIDTCAPQKLVVHAKKRLRTVWKIERNVTAYIRIHYNWDFLLRLVFLNQDITKKAITNKPEQVSVDKFREELSAQLPKALGQCFNVQLKQAECLERGRKEYRFSLVFQIPNYMRRVTTFDPHSVDVEAIERNVEKYLSGLYGTDFAIRTEVIYRIS
uniref:F-box domain-containing protein n=1 Tax=Steinernema glaseri TaxID=37863 RepID=A0A1I8AA11_9BILA